MKRITALVLAVLMLAALLCACSATANMDPYGGYSNVSTTRHTNQRLLTLASLLEPAAAGH